MTRIARRTPPSLILLLAVFFRTSWAFVGQVPPTCLPAAVESRRAQGRMTSTAAFMSAEPAAEQEVSALRIEDASANHKGWRACCCMNPLGWLRKSWTFRRWTLQVSTSNKKKMRRNCSPVLRTNRKLLNFQVIFPQHSPKATCALPQHASLAPQLSAAAGGVNVAALRRLIRRGRKKKKSILRRVLSSP